MFKIKICGITSVEDALLAAEAGADAIGLNFYEQSPRYVTPERGAEVTQALMPLRRSGTWNGWAFGVFVNATLEDAQKIAKRSGASNWQLHGDEPASMVAALSGTLNVPAYCEQHYPQVWQFFHDSSGRMARSFATIRAFRCREANLNSIHAYLAKCKEAGALPHAVLLDAYQPGAYGGTGQVVDWNVVRNERDLLMGLPVILAGGLTPENVAEAIATARPDAVDVASGVESSPGKKDPEKVRRFIAEAQQAFEKLAAAR